MYTDEDLTAAVKEGIFTEEAVDTFRNYIAGINNEKPVDEEHFRFVTSFNDIFVVIACALLLVAVGWIGESILPWLGTALAAGTSWLLSEMFARKRRMALPSMVLLLAFTGNALATCVLLLGHDSAGWLTGSAISAGLTWLHWKRFHVPITVAAGTAAVCGALIAFLFAAVPTAREWTTPIVVVTGLAVFALAMWWDISDLKRQTLRSDVAFWLHLLAAPLLVHPFFASLGVLKGQTTLGQAGMVIAVYAVIALISLTIDRRALMVSALGYVLYTFSTLLKQFGNISLSFAIAALVIGSALLLLAVFWHPCRLLVLRLLPENLREQLPAAN